MKKHTVTYVCDFCGNDAQTTEGWFELVLEIHSFENPAGAAVETGHSTKVDACPDCTDFSFKLDLTHGNQRPIIYVGQVELDWDD